MKKLTPLCTAIDEFKFDEEHKTLWVYYLGQESKDFPFIPEAYDDLERTCISCATRRAEDCPIDLIKKMFEHI